MGPVQWVLLLVFVGILGFLGLKSGLPGTPLMPAVKNPEALRPAPKVLTAPPSENAPPASEATAPAAPPPDSPTASPTDQ